MEELRNDLYSYICSLNFILHNNPDVFFKLDIPIIKIKTFKLYFVKIFLRPRIFGII